MHMQSLMRPDVREMASTNLRFAARGSTFVQVLNSQEQHESNQFIVGKWGEMSVDVHRYPSLSSLVDCYLVKREDDEDAQQKLYFSVV